jgi:plasmid stabilization system protein ParE
MKYHVQISPQALEEVEEAYLWIRDKAPMTAARWYDRLMQAIDSLGDNPESYPLAPDAEAFDVPLRQMLFGKRSGIYRILFTVHGNVVRVHHIRHGAQKFLEPPKKPSD